MKQKRYIVEDIEKGNYLTKGYYKGERTEFFSEAYKFTPFELKLAKSVFLIPNSDYRVYQVEVEDDSTR